jgi:hypothetical protein
MAKKIKSTNPNKTKRARDAGTGKFIPLKEAKKRPRTTVVETR